jgi:hypothetical protein
MKSRSVTNVLFFPDDFIKMDRDKNCNTFLLVKKGRIIVTKKIPKGKSIDTAKKITDKYL